MRRNRPDIHVNQERWLVSYADFITLLFAFFVVMYSISQVNESKYQALTKTLGQAFATSDKAVVAPGAATDMGPIDKPPSDINPIEFSTPASADTYNALADLVNERFSTLVDEQLINVTSNDDWLKIELKDSILFASADAEPSDEARRILREVASILKYYAADIQVEGHTDNLPISQARYPSNWELSSARASAIVKYLIEEGMPANRMAAVGYGEFQPIAENTHAEGRAQNRRVVIMIAKRPLNRL